MRLAIVVPVFNEESVLPHTIRCLSLLINDLIADSKISVDSYVVFVDDGSDDESWNILEDLCKESSNIKAIKLSRNYGHNTALLAGLLKVKDFCDVSISIDCDLQQDPNAIPLFIDKYKKGAEVVFGVRSNRRTDGYFKKYTALGFYNFMKLMGVNLHSNHADYRLLSNKALNAISKYQEPNIFLRAVCVDIGFSNDIVYFDVNERKYGSSKYSLYKMFKFAINGITSFSSFPLRMISVLGAVVFGLSILMSLYILFTVWIVDEAVPGWASTVLPIYLLGGVQILCLGIVGEYLAQIYKATKKRPRYLIEMELF